MPTSRAATAAALLALLCGCTRDVEREPSGPWSVAGGTVDPEVVASAAGPAHCDWQAAHLLEVTWPLPGTTSAARELRSYVRDPDGVLPGGDRQGRFRPEADLPADARSTGYVNDGWELWFAPSDDSTTAYLVRDGGRTVEAWPRDAEPPACA